MEQPPEEAPEARPEEEKEEAAKAEGAPELNGGPEHSLPSSSYAGEGVAGDTDGVGTGRLACCEQHCHGVQGSRVGKGWSRAARGLTPALLFISCSILGKSYPFFL